MAGFFNRPSWLVHIYENGIHPSGMAADEFIYYDNAEGHCWSDSEATRRLKAAESWHRDHAMIPISGYALSHWSEYGLNTLSHIRDRWGCDLLATYCEPGQPLESADWIRSGPFRLFDEPGSALTDELRLGLRPVYYADEVQFAGQRFFLCLTEIRDDAGYEWAPCEDVETSANRGVRQLRRALDSFALPVLFTHETDYLYRIAPNSLESQIKLISHSLREYGARYVTLEEGIRIVRAVRRSRLEEAHYDPTSCRITAQFSGSAGRATCVYVFSDEE